MPSPASARSIHTAPCVASSCKPSVVQVCSTLSRARWLHTCRAAGSTQLGQLTGTNANDREPSRAGEALTAPRAAEPLGAAQWLWLSEAAQSFGGLKVNRCARNAASTRNVVVFRLLVSYELDDQAEGERAPGRFQYQGAGQREAMPGQLGNERDSHVCGPFSEDSWKLTERSDSTLVLKWTSRQCNACWPTRASAARPAAGRPSEGFAIKSVESFLKCLEIHSISEAAELHCLS